MALHHAACIQPAITSLDQPEPPSSLRDTPRNIAAAALLTVSGGMLDAIVWILHGHVFATAMTGNTVLLGVALLAHDPRQALRHTLPLITFAAGILLGWTMLRRLGKAGRLDSRKGLSPNSRSPKSLGFRKGMAGPGRCRQNRLLSFDE